MTVVTQSVMLSSTAVILSRSDPAPASVQHGGHTPAAAGPRPPGRRYRGPAMRAMWRTTVQGVLARKVRLALTALSIVLGVAFVAGVYVLTDTLRRSFDVAFAQTGVGIDLVVRHEGAFDGDGQGRDRPQLPEDAVDRVRAVPGVADADGLVQGFAQFVDRSGDTVTSAGAPTIGISWPTRPGVGPLRLAAGRAPQRDGEVAMDDATARRLGYRV